MWAIPSEGQVGDSWLELFAAFDRSGFRTKQYDEALLKCDKKAADKRSTRRQETRTRQNQKCEAEGRKAKPQRSMIGDCY